MVLKTIRIFCQSRPRAFRLNGSFENLNLLVYLSQQKVRLGNHKKGYQFFFYWNGLIQCMESRKIHIN